MRVLIACEESQTVCKAFRARGHEAFSCDLQDCSGGHPEWHIHDYVQRHLYTDWEKWDLVIAFPPCTDLAVSGARWFKEKRDRGIQYIGVDFFMMFTNLHKIGVKWAIENPIGIMSTKYRKPDQIIQPWQFGHKETKATCLWLNGLPKLIPTNIVGPPPRIKGMLMDDAMKIRKEWNKCHRQPPGPDRARIRSKTYEGIAKAMAEQWG